MRRIARRGTISGIARRRTSVSSRDLGVVLPVLCHNHRVVVLLCLIGAFTLPVVTAIVANGSISFHFPDRRNDTVTW